MRWLDGITDLMHVSLREHQGNSRGWLWTGEAWRAAIHGVAKSQTRLNDFHFSSFPGDPDHKESACNAGGLGLIPGSGRSPGEGNGYPLQYSCLENTMNRGAWRASAHGVAKSWIQLSD